MAVGSTSGRSDTEKSMVQIPHGTLRVWEQELRRHLVKNFQATVPEEGEYRVQAMSARQFLEHKKSLCRELLQGLNCKQNCLATVAYGAVLTGELQTDTLD